jgi:hypothetical protein
MNGVPVVVARFELRALQLMLQAYALREGLDAARRLVESFIVMDADPRGGEEDRRRDAPSLPAAPPPSPESATTDAVDSRAANATSWVEPAPPAPVGGLPVRRWADFSEDEDDNDEG